MKDNAVIHACPNIPGFGLFFRGRIAALTERARAGSFARFALLVCGWGVVPSAMDLERFLANGAAHGVPRTLRMIVGDMRPVAVDLDRFPAVLA